MTCLVETVEVQILKVVKYEADNSSSFHFIHTFRFRIKGISVTLTFDLLVWK